MHAKTDIQYMRENEKHPNTQTDVYVMEPIHVRRQKNQSHLAKESYSTCLHDWGYKERHLQRQILKIRQNE